MPTQTFSPKQDFVPNASYQPQAQKKYEPILNDNGFVVQFKPKNDNQALISDRFQEFFEQNLKGKGFTKETINSFYDSRNFYMRQEANDKVEAFFAKTLAQIEKGTYGYKSTSFVKAENEQAKAVEEYVKDFVAQAKAAMGGKANKAFYNTVTDIANLYKDLANQGQDTSGLEAEFQALYARAQSGEFTPKVQQKSFGYKQDGGGYNKQNYAKNYAQNAAPKQSYKPREVEYNGNDNSAMNGLREEAKNFETQNVEKQAPQTQNAKQTYKYRQR